MSKTAIRRHNTYRLINKFKKLKNKHNYRISDTSLSFGRIFSKDPIDCGVTSCYCKNDSWLVFKPKNNNIDFSDYYYDYINYYDDIHYD